MTTARNDDPLKHQTARAVGHKLSPTARLPRLKSRDCFDLDARAVVGRRFQRFCRAEHGRTPTCFYKKIKRTPTTAPFGYRKRKSVFASLYTGGCYVERVRGSRRGSRENPIDATLYRDSLLCAVVGRSSTTAQGRNSLKLVGT
jgi:hypothetical protein